MTILANLKRPVCNSNATMDNMNAFPRMVAMVLNATVGSPRLTKPSRKPLVPGMILQGPVFKNLAMPNPPLKTEVARVIGYFVYLSFTIPFDTARTKRM